MVTRVYAFGPSRTSGGCVLMMLSDDGDGLRVRGLGLTLIGVLAMITQSGKLGHK
jgi:hypothetical protein